MKQVIILIVSILGFAHANNSIIQANNQLCVGQPEGAKFQNPDNCNTFFHCSHGIAYLGQCPANLWFNPLIDRCDDPQNVKCGAVDRPEEDDIECPEEDDEGTFKSIFELVLEVWTPDFLWT